MTKSIRFESELAIESRGFARSAFNETVTKEKLYYAPGDGIIDFSDGVKAMIDGSYKAFRKAMKSNSTVSINFYLVEYNHDTFVDISTVSRYAVYVSWSQVRSVHVLRHGYQQESEDAFDGCENDDHSRARAAMLLSRHDPDRIYSVIKEAIQKYMQS